eukprot:6105873-Heterocapsa_arctica.AAC.1
MLRKLQEATSLLPSQQKMTPGERHTHEGPLTTLEPPPIERGQAKKTEDNEPWPIADQWTPTDSYREEYYRDGNNKVHQLGVVWGSRQHQLQVPYWHHSTR